jgi:tryptophanyl-tRNA synthetase
MSKAIVLTGLRANSEFHIGNYLGGILPVIELQKHHAGECQINMFVPDLHSFTTPIDHSKLYRQIIDNLKVFVAAGLDINNPDTYIYRQSFIPAHTELAWILDCFTGYGELRRMTQFKDKSGGDEDHVSVGLFNYPVLMAADILVYGATYIPVGDDQKQHLELVRDLALRMNNTFGQDLFTVPAEWKSQLSFTSRDKGVRIRSLRNPDKKMSKSVSDPSGTIMISDTPATAAQKILRAETDSVGSIHFDFATQPGISNLLQMLSLLTNRPQYEVNAEWEGKSKYGDLKKAVAEASESFLSTLQRNLAMVDEVALMKKLEADEHTMNELANQRLALVRKAVGVRQ